MLDLLMNAENKNLRVFFLPLERIEGYLSEAGDIVVNSQLTEAHQRQVLAHELGHVHYGHDWRFRHNKAKDERQADLYAARLLISHSEYALAARIHDDCQRSIASELGVSQRLLKLWSEQLVSI